MEFEEAPPKASTPENLLLEMNLNDELTSLALGFKDERIPMPSRVVNPNHHPDITIRYSSEDCLRIYKTLGRFESPLLTPQLYSLNVEDP